MSSGPRRTVPMTEEVLEKIRRLAVETDMTNQELAERFGIPYNRIYRIVGARERAPHGQARHTR